MDFNEIKLIKNDHPLYIQLAKHIKNQIINNKILHGEKLPTIRAAANILNVNTSTVINCYKILENEGFVTTIKGSGSYVTKNIKKRDKLYMDFTGKDSQIESFPIDEITSSINYILKHSGVDIFKYEDSRGNYELKESLVDYFKYFSIKTTIDLLQIISGGQQALDIISKSLLNFGDTVFTESPTYRGALESFKNREARIIEVQLDEDGLNILDLESKIVTRRPTILYLMTFNQKPTGYNYSLEKKHKILELSQKYNFYIIEDDQGSEISLKETKTLKSMDTYDRVIYIKSFSPLFMPGLRLGCLIPPKSLYNRILKTKLSTDISTPGLLQKSFAHYLAKNNWIDYFENIKTVKKEKIELTNLLLNTYLGNKIECNMNSDSGSYWLKLNRIDVDLLSKECFQKGVEFLSGTIMGSEYKEFIRLNIASIPKTNIEDGLKIIQQEIIKQESTNRRVSLNPGF
ncbi:MAG: PLP-dependent aminotransferase family protein [Spirochaetales bacterium]|nr:PLP-dependent aminotransferase family protein [Spirochaetales bacterium]